MNTPVLQHRSTLCDYFCLHNFFFVKMSDVMFLGDSTCDLAIDPDSLVYVVWAVGPLGDTAFRHARRADRKPAYKAIYLVMMNR